MRTTQIWTETIDEVDYQIFTVTGDWSVARAWEHALNLSEYLGLEWDAYKMDEEDSQGEFLLFGSPAGRVHNLSGIKAQQVTIPDFARQNVYGE